MLVKTAVVLILLQLGSVQGCPDQQCQALVEEVAELKEGMAKLKTGIRELKESMRLLLEQHETMSKKHTSRNQKMNKKFEAIQETVDSIKMQMAEADKHTQTFRNESDQKATQIKEELSDMMQKIDISFTAVQDTLEEKVWDNLETLRSETAQLALTVGRDITQIKEELSDVKQSAITNFAAVGMNLTTIKSELVGIKQRTNTSFTAVQDTLGDLETEQQKVGGGLETLRSETAQLALTVRRNITQIEEELSDGFAAVEVNLEGVEMRQLEMKEDIQELKNGTSEDSVTVAYPYIATTCSEIIERIHNSPPGYYQLRAPNGTITTELCAHSCADIAKWIPSSPPGYYQLWAPNGTITTEYCFASSCSEKAERDPYSPPGYYQLRAPNGTITTEYCFANSCAEKVERDPSSPPGYYQLRAPNGTITTEYCPMECKKCLAIKSTGGWRRVAYLNMTYPTHQCPSGFRLFTEPRRCSPRISGPSGCASVTYPVHGIPYQRVCGRVIAYHKGSTTAFGSRSGSINVNYVSGVSLTHGSPFNRHHIWTFAAAWDEQDAKRWWCPCSDTTQNFTGSVPDFIGDDYFCDSGTRVWRYGPLPWAVFTEDPLWDGSGCGPTSSCCTFNSPPWFCKELPQPTTDDIELRGCRRGYYNYRDVQINQIELYTQ